MARSITFESLFLKKVSDHITRHIKGKPGNGFKIISLYKNGDNFNLKFKILPSELETRAGDYFLTMGRQAKTPGALADVLFTLLVQKIGPDNKKETTINARASKENARVTPNTILELEHMRRFWKKLSELHEKQKARVT